MQTHMVSIRTKSTDGRGCLSFFEASADLSFPIKRIYYIYSVPKGIQRGGHAHKKLQQFLWCPYGSIAIEVDDGTNRSTYVLDRPDKGLVMASCVWRETVWMKENAVLCVAASEDYDEEDYIRQYDAFIDYVRERKSDG